MKTNLTTIKYSATWCKPCQALNEWLADKDVDIVSKDVEEYAEEATQYNIRTVPCMVVLDEHGALVKKLSNTEECKQWVEEMLS